MNRCVQRCLALSSFAVLLCGCATERVDVDVNPRGVPDGPAHQLQGRGYIQQWLVLGAFPNPELPEPLPDGTRYLGFSTDYLETLGGEGRAVVLPDTQVSYTEEDGAQRLATTQVCRTDPDGVLDLDHLYDHPDYRVAYAFCHILADEAQTAGFFLGSDDGVKVWVNGQLVHSHDVARALRRGEDRFTAELNAGSNTLLVKVTDWVRDWGLAVEVADAPSYAAALESQREKEAYGRFLDCQVVPLIGNHWNGIFTPGKFPDVGWDRPELVEQALGEFPLEVRWFDGQLNEVDTPAQPGRYAFVATGTTPDGMPVRRAATVYCKPHDWLVWSERPEASVEFLPGSRFDADAWQEHSQAISAYAGRILVLSTLKQQEGAVLMSYIHELKSTGGTPASTDTPTIRDHDYHLALKRKLLGVEGKYPPLRMPREIKGRPAPTLRVGTEQEAGFAPGTAEKIRAVCQQWHQESGEPFVTLIARNGVVVLHEAFGEPDGEVTLDTRLPMASITKLLTGLMFAQFVDQGLIDIDDPVGKFLPDFPTEGDKAITLRQCFTHTTGLQGHAEWGGVHNPWLDNVIANNLRFLPVGQVHIYNGMGYDLAGKVMEIVSGKSIFRLMRENFFDPLGANGTFLEEDLAFGASCTAWDTALFGQLLLNKGAYGNRQFFSPEVLERMMPAPLAQFYPAVNVEWGIGLTWMRQSHPEAGKSGNPKNKTILSRNMFGHGAATSAILRVDPDNNLVIAQTRRVAGKAYSEYLLKLLMTIEAGLVD
jgi:CubicO group peptidase (beta-lactamase class C family)